MRDIHLSKITDRRGQENLGVGKIIKGILVLLVIVLAILAFVKAGGFKMLTDMLSDNNPLIDEKIVEQQKAIPDEQKLFGKNCYPSVFLIYDGGNPNVYAFRWNPVINAVQINLAIEESVGWTGTSVPTYASSEWLLTPYIVPEFGDEDYVVPDERQGVMFVMDSMDESVMIQRLASVSYDDKNIIGPNTNSFKIKIITDWCFSNTLEEDDDDIVSFATEDMKPAYAPQEIKTLLEAQATKIWDHLSTYLEYRQVSSEATDEHGQIRYRSMMSWDSLSLEDSKNILPDYFGESEGDASEYLIKKDPDGVMVLFEVFDDKAGGKIYETKKILNKSGLLENLITNYLYIKNKVIPSP